jgi:probable O-glycosylation ligase (exosortase A-associated)
MSTKWAYPGGTAEWWRPEAAHGGTAVTAEPRELDQNETPFWALMAFTFILLIAPQNFLPIGALRPALLAGAVAAGAYLLDRIRRGRPLTDFTPEIVLAGFLAGWAVLTIPFSYWPGGSISFFLALYLKALIIFWLIAHVVVTVSRLRIAAWLLALMSVPLAGAAAIHFFAGEFLPDGARRIPGYEAALTGNPNDLALMLNLILPLVVALFRLTPRVSLRYLLAGIILLDVAAVILTFSRAGFLTLALVFALFLWKFGRQKRLGLILAALLTASVAIPLLPSGYSERLSTISDIQADITGSAQQRWNDAKVAAHYTLQHPIVGAGIGMDELAMNEQRGPEWKKIHNVYLQYSVELGLPGLLLFCLLFRSVYRSVQWVQARSRNVEGRQDLFKLAEGLQIALLAFAVAAFFYPVGYHYYFYYFAGLAVAARKIGQADVRR